MTTRVRTFPEEGLETWLSRKVRSGALLTLPTYRPENSRFGQRPEKVARALLDALTRSDEASDVRAEALAFRAWVETQPGEPSRISGHAPRGHRYDGTLRPDDIHHALRTIADPPPLAPGEDFRMSWPVRGPLDQRRSRLSLYILILLAHFLLLLAVLGIAPRVLDVRIWGDRITEVLLGLILGHLLAFVWMTRRIQALSRWSRLSRSKVWKTRAG